MTGEVAPVLVAAAVVAGLCGVVRPSASHQHEERLRAIVPVGSRAERPPARAFACPVWFAEAASAADIGSVERWWGVVVSAVGVAGLAGASVGGVVGGAVGTVVVVAGTGGALRANRHRREARLSRSVPDALDAVARACRAGRSVPQALSSLRGDLHGPAAEVLRSVADRHEHGESLRSALDQVVRRHPLPDLRLAAVALLVGAETGAAPARAVEGVAATVRDRHALEREAAAHATQARASAAVLVVAPVGFGVFTVAADPRVAEFLFGTPAGVGCLLAGTALDAVGAVWMAGLVRSVS